MKFKEKIAIVLITIFVLSLFGNILNNCVLAEINPGYSVDEEIEESERLNDLFNGKDEDKKSSMMDYLGGFIYGISLLIEDTVTGIFKTFSGNNIFPWADRVIFNTIPFLDINFFNPSNGSLFYHGEETLLSKIVRNTYFSILALSIGFLSVVVGIMAIKLAITAVASDKARYKESIVNVLYAIVFIFMAHFFISIIFFVNEKIVEIASQVAKNTISSYNEVQDVPQEEKELIGNVKVNTYNDMFTSFKELINAEYDYYNRDENFCECWNNSFLISIINYKKEKFNYSWDTEFTTLKEHITPAELYNHLEDFAVNNYFGYDGKEFKLEKNSSKDALDRFIDNEMQQYYNDWNIGNYDYDIIYNSIVGYYKEIGLEVDKDGNVYKVSTTSTSSNQNNGNLSISSMGITFREAAGKTKKGWFLSRVSFEAAILYAIFIVQSLAYLFAYIKRFFYVIVLALMAPLVVIYDFLGKAIS